MAKKPARVAIYVRVSTLQQIDKDSLPMQRQDLIAYAKLMLDTEDYVIFEDAGYSGKNTDRPQFQKMMTQIRQGLFTHLLVWKIDRISRNLLDFATMYKELKDLGVIFVSKNEQFDTGTAMGEAMLKIILVFAELERNMTSERVRATMLSRASNGIWNGGRVPFGYSYDPETLTFSVNEPEARIVRMIHDLYEEQNSMVRVARILNEKGYRSRAGNEWSPTSVLLILRNVFYCGDYRYNVLKEGNRQKVRDKSEWVTVRDHHVPIMTRQRKERVIATLEANARLSKNYNTRHPTKHTHIFGGVVFCESCGKPMNSAPRPPTADGWQYSRYVCPSKLKRLHHHEGKSVTDPVLGEFIFNYILNMLNAQRDFDNIHSPRDLQTALLTGDAFACIAGIEPDGLNDLYHILSVGDISGEVYGRTVRTPEKADSELGGLRAEKQRLERALERLANLYLYAEEAMSESEYLLQKAKLMERLDEVTEQISFSSSDAWRQSISDEAFVRQASEFIIAQKLTDRHYISYKRLAMNVDSGVLKSFVSSIIDRINILNGRVKTIVFRNGLSHTFVFRQDSQ